MLHQKTVSKRFTRGIWWIKRDFRLFDNDALCQAIDECDSVLPLFIIEPSLCAARETSFFHYHAWQQAGGELHEALLQRGSALQLWVGEVCEVLDTLLQSTGFDALYSHEETGSDITYQRDKSVGLWARRNQIPWRESHQNGVIRGLVDRGKRNPIIRQRLLQAAPKPVAASVPAWQPETIPKASTKPSAETDAPVSITPRRVQHWPEFEQMSISPIDSRIQIDSLQPISERHAQQDLHSFLHTRGLHYSGGISSPNSAFTAGSRLSAHLAWGSISLRQVFHALTQRDQELASMPDAQSRRWRKSLRAFQSRLHWHDHFMQRLESAPAMEFETINPAYRHLGYAHNDALPSAWQTGHTGLPLVDACIRCLAATGFLNFRMRAMLVSVGCYGMAQSWRSLQYPLARLFRDYEPGIHFSQIQMQAGVVGINTLRIYSPYKQLIDQDPQAIFVKRWIPELREFDAVQIARYEEQPLGNYPQPITDFDANTRIIRDQIYAIRKSAAGKLASKEVLKQHGSRLPGNDRARANRRKQRIKENQEAQNRQLNLDFDE